MTEAQIKHMVDRFLGWRLPDNFCPDGGISFKATFNEHTAHPMRHEPTGTNLFYAEQATAMVRYMVEGLPQSTDFAWLIEAPGQHYLAARKLGSSRNFYWTRDHANAIRFASAEQADLTMMAIRDLAPDLFGFAATLGDARPVEHGWMRCTCDEAFDTCYQHGVGSIPGVGRDG